MSDLPTRIEIHEEGPREGFQFEPEVYPLEDRARLVDMLSDTGLEEIQVASFVNPKKVPQMADAAQLFGAIRKKPGVRHTALWLNARGFETARQTKGVDLRAVLLLHTSDEFSQRNNGCSVSEMRARQRDWAALYEDAGLRIEAVYIMTAFGCALQGDVPLSSVLDAMAWAEAFAPSDAAHPPPFYLADTVGWATPKEVERRIGAVRERRPDLRIGLHLHDTRGAGLANAYAAMRLGVDLFDSSVAGLGGCPFAGHGHGSAAGNICTEDLVFMAHEMGVETGVDLEALIAAARFAERLIGRPLPGRVMHSGSLATFRSPA